ncbi:MAG: hypothetical protein ACFFG0_04475 [Candidatus Thorarchaeota archaeon]
MKEYYEEIEVKAIKFGNCLCGKKLKRSKTFTQTLNPFNLKDGRLKTRSEILYELEEEANKWKTEQVHCEILTYWEWSEEERKKYDNEGMVMIEAKCGSLIKQIKKDGLPRCEECGFFLGDSTQAMCNCGKYKW